MPTMPSTPQTPDPSRASAGTGLNQSPTDSPSSGGPREIQMPAWLDQAIEQSQRGPGATMRPTTAGPNPPNNAGSPQRPTQPPAGGPPKPPLTTPQTPASAVPNRPAAPPAAGTQPSSPSPATVGGPNPSRISETPTPAAGGGPTTAPPPGRIAPHPSAPGAASARPYISSRLREKIMEADSTVEKEPQPMRPLLIGGGIVLVLVVAGLLAWSMGLFGGGAPESKPQVPGANAPAQQPASGPTAATPPATTPATTPPAGGAPAGGTTAGSTAPGGTTPPAATQPTSPATPPATTAAKPPAPKPAATTAAAPAAPAVKRIYGLAIGTFMDETRAKEKADQIGGAAGLPATVMTVKEGGTDVYRAVVGRFDSRSAAEGAAANVISKGASEARVVQVGTEK